MVWDITPLIEGKTLPYTVTIKPLIITGYSPRVSVKKALLKPYFWRYRVFGEPWEEKGQEKIMKRHKKGK